MAKGETRDKSERMGEVKGGLSGTQAFVWRVADSEFGDLEHAVVVAVGDVKLSCAGVDGDAVRAR